jgi:hypothetical protein
MKDKILKIFKNHSFHVQPEEGPSYEVIDGDDFNTIADEVVALFEPETKSGDGDIINDINLIVQIREIINKYGEFSTLQATADTSPCFCVQGGLTHLVEDFSLEGAKVYVYSGEEVIDKYDICYTDLDDEQLRQIVAIGEKWKEICLDDMSDDFKAFLGKDDSYFSEGHLMGWFNEQYRSKTLDEVRYNLNVNHDVSSEWDNAENELGRELNEVEKEALTERFNEAVLNSLVTKNDVVIGFTDSCGDELCEGYR